MTNNLNHFECKKAKAGEILYDSTLTGNVLLFVSAGKLLISNQKRIPIVEVNEGQFVLLPAKVSHITIALTSARTILMHAGPLSEMITEDPAWNPELPVVLPIFPSLARTLYLIECYQKERENSLN